MIPVILGVLIALFINNWKDRVDDKKFLSTALTAIEKEIEEDEELLRDIVPRQYALVDTIKLYLDDDAISITDCIINSDGLQVYTTKNSSWWSLLNTKIELVGFKTISTISNMEQTRQFTALKTNKLMDFVLENMESKESNKKKILIFQILNLIESEEGLLEMYEEEKVRPNY